MAPEADLLRDKTAHATCASRPSMKCAKVLTLTFLLTGLSVLLGDVRCSNLAAGAAKCTMIRGLEKCLCSYATNQAASDIHDISAIECINQNLTTHLSLAMLPDRPDTMRLVKLVFVGNIIPELDPNLFGTCYHNGPRSLDKLIHLNMSHNNIKTIHGKTFHCAPNIETLDLGHNEWLVDTNKQRVFSNMPRMKSLYLQNAFARYEPSTTGKRPPRHIPILEDIFRGSNLTELELLDLSDSSLQSYHVDIFCYLPSLQTVRLSRNYIADVVFNATCMKTLQRMDLDDNTVSFLEHSAIQQLSRMPTLKHLNLSLNPFQCDCILKEFQHWLKSNNSGMVEDKDSLRCYKPRLNMEVVGRRLTEVAEEQLVCASSHSHTVPAPFVVLAVILSLVGVAVIIIVLVNREKVKVKATKYWWRIKSLNFPGKWKRSGYTTVSHVSESGHV